MRSTVQISAIARKQQLGCADAVLAKINARAGVHMKVPRNGPRPDVYRMTTQSHEIWHDLIDRPWNESLVHPRTAQRALQR